MDALEFMTVGRKTIGVYTALCTPVCKRYGINNTCLDVLMFLHNYPGYNTARDLCQVRGIKTGMASVAVDTLVRRGFLIAEDDADDRRVRRLSVAPAAADVIRDGTEVQRQFVESVGRGIGEDDREAFRRVIGCVLGNLNELEVKNGNGN